MLDTLWRRRRRSRQRTRKTTPRTTPARRQAAPTAMPAMAPLESGCLLVAADGASCVAVGAGVVVVCVEDCVSVVLEELLVGVAVINVTWVEDGAERLLSVLVASVAVGTGCGEADEVMGAKVKTPLCEPNLSVAVTTPPLAVATSFLPLQIS